MNDDAEARLRRLGLTLPIPGAAQANYVPTVRTGNLIFVAGQIPTGPDGPVHVGRLGGGLGVEEGQAAARLCALAILAHAKAAAGSLAAIARVVKLTGFVNGTPEFREPHKVINGASDLLTEVLGERGRHARSAVVVAGLPFGVAVEVEAILEVDPALSG